jgi:hypothetical protein
LRASCFYVTALAGAATLALMAGCTSLAPGKAASTPPPARTAAQQPPAPPVGASDAPVGGACNAQGAQWALGRNATAKVVEEARTRSGARMARVLYKGQAAAAQEIDPERLNLEVNDSGKVTGARCG